MRRAEIKIRCSEIVQSVAFYCRLDDALVHRDYRRGDFVHRGFHPAYFGGGDCRLGGACRHDCRYGYQPAWPCCRYRKILAVSPVGLFSLAAYLCPLAVAFCQSLSSAYARSWQDDFSRAQHGVRRVQHDVPRCLPRLFRWRPESLHSVVDW